VTGNDLLLAIAGTTDHPLCSTSTVVVGSAKHRQPAKLLIGEINQVLVLPLATTTFHPREVAC
jgi:hypothetical protein